MPLDPQDDFGGVLLTRVKVLEKELPELELRLTSLANHVHEMDMKGMEHGEMLLRIGSLESKMDDLPSRVGNLEKYGSDVTIKLPEIIKLHDDRLNRLEKKPKKKQRKERERWARQQQRINLYIAVASVLAVLLSTYVNFLLFHH